MTKKAYFMHPKAMVESNNVGKDTRIWPFAHILKGAKIGKNCNIGEYCYIENDVTIGNDVTIKNAISIWDGVSIQDKVFLGPNVVFTNDIIPRSKIRRKVVKTLVEKGATLGANVTVVAGVTIREYAMIGAGSVVTKDVPAYTLAYGNPARANGYVCECGLKLKIVGASASCKCKRVYKMEKGKIKQKRV